MFGGLCHGNRYCADLSKVIQGKPDVPFTRESMLKSLRIATLCLDLVDVPPGAILIPMLRTRRSPSWNWENEKGVELKDEIKGIKYKLHRYKKNFNNRVINRKTVKAKWATGLRKQRRHESHVFTGTVNQLKDKIKRLANVMGMLVFEDLEAHAKTTSFVSSEVDFYFKDDLKTSIENGLDIHSPLAEMLFQAFERRMATQNHQTRRNWENLQAFICGLKSLEDIQIRIDDQINEEFRALKSQKDSLLS